MDWESRKQRLVGCVTKYRYVFLMLLVGILLLLLPEDSGEPVPVPEQEVVQLELQLQLEEILEEISGVGKARVLLTEAAGGDTIYQVNTDRNQSGMDTVIVMNGQREELGLVKQIIPPVYRGAVVVCQGAGNAAVRLAVVEAVKCVTGLSSDCITVLEMK